LFEAAAKQYSVPKETLLAMNYVDTRWEMPPADASNYEEGSLKGKRTFGIMALVQNPTSDTLGDAAKATSISVQTLKTDRKSNILGGAALLAKL
jgi:predicted transcriptional regulator